MDDQKLRAPLDAVTKERKILLENVKRFSKVPKRESPEDKVIREEDLAVTKLELEEATAVYATAIQACYDLFCKLLADDPLTQWDRIVKEVHESDPWTSLTGQKRAGLHEDLRVP